MDLKKLCHEIVEIAQETASYICNESENFDSTRIETKGLHDFVSYVDKNAEISIIEKLRTLLPEAGFLAEEGTTGLTVSKYQWVIDPLDGTTNFLHKIHPHSISIALRENDEIIAGVVYEISGNETFIAWKNGGAWLNSNRITVSAVTTLQSGLIATGFPYKDFSRLEPYLNCLRHFINHSSGVRRMGCASIDLAYVACGRFEGFFEYGLNPWDVAAGILLVREAGGIVSDFSGSEKNITGLEIVAASHNLFPEIQSIICNFMI